MCVRFQLWTLTGRPIRVAARLLGLWVRIPVGACMNISCGCCMHSTRRLLQNVVCLSVIDVTRKKCLGPLSPSCHEKILSVGFPANAVTKLIAPRPWSVSDVRHLAAQKMRSVRYSQYKFVCITEQLNSVQQDPHC